MQHHLLDQRRSVSYDESFLHRSPDREFVQLDPQQLRTATSRRRAAEAPPVLRTNFGKSRVYVPPITTEWNPASIQQYDDDMPFDQEQSQIVARVIKDRIMERNVSSSTPPPPPTTPHPEQQQAQLPPRSPQPPRRGPTPTSPTTTTSRTSSPLVDDYTQQLWRRSVSPTRPFDEEGSALHSIMGRSGSWTEYDPSLQRHQQLLQRPPRPVSTNNNNNKYDYHASKFEDRFQIPPFRVSEPAIAVDDGFVSDEESDMDDTLNANSTTLMDASMDVHIANGDQVLDSSYEDFHVHTDDSVTADYLVNHPTGEMREPVPKDDDDDDDDDSIFDFEKLRPNKSTTSAGLGHARSSRREQEEEEELQPYETDDNSLDHPYEGKVGPPRRDLDQERSYKAWKRAQHRSSSKQALPKTTTAQPPAYHHSVKFGKDDMVQYYQPASFPDEEETAEDATTWDASVLGGRSLNSYYTKSAESEVEDFIKDILLIGSGQVNHPGRRKLKYSPHVRRRLQERNGGHHHHDRHHRQVRGVDDETLTLDTFDETEELETEGEDYDSEMEPPSTAQHYLDHSNDTRHPPTDAPLPLRGVKHNSDRHSTTTGTLTSTTVDRSSLLDRNSLVVQSTVESTTVDTTLSASTATSDDPLSSLWDFLFGAPDTGDGKAKKRTTSKKQQGSDGGDGLEGLLNLASFFGGPVTENKTSKEKNRAEPQGESDPDSESDQASIDGPIRPRRKESRSPVPPVTRAGALVEERVSVEEELRLVDLARQAARCMHRIRGHEFDDTYKINIATDIIFSVVDLEMPLGLIFQENEIGCWVTKVLPSGSASRNGKVQVGDQLAAIDGVSAIDLKVGQMAELVTSKTSDIEFTFLRYIGPLRPLSGGSVLEEGYEVPTQTKVRSKRIPPPVAAATPKKKILFGRNTSPRSVNNFSLESEKSPTKTTAPETKRGRFRLFRIRKGAK